VIPVNPFDATGDAQTLRSAMAGLGTDETKIINVLCYRSSDQRAKIAQEYLNLYGTVGKIEIH